MRLPAFIFQQQNQPPSFPLPQLIKQRGCQTQASRQQALAIDYRFVKRERTCQDRRWLMRLQRVTILTLIPASVSLLQKLVAT